VLTHRSFLFLLPLPYPIRLNHQLPTPAFGTRERSERSDLSSSEASFLWSGFFGVPAELAFNPTITFFLTLTEPLEYIAVELSVS